MAALSAAEWSPAGPSPTVATESSALSIRELFDAHFDFIWRSVRRLGLSVAEADDAAQSVFIVAARRLDAIARGKERAFLFGTAVRVVADVRKGAARRYELGLEDREIALVAPGADVLIDESRARQCLEAAIVAMPMDLRTVFVLFELEELTMAQIAEVLSLPPGTVASRLRRARDVFEDVMKKLKARFGGGA